VYSRQNIAPKDWHPKEHFSAVLVMKQRLSTVLAITSFVGQSASVRIVGHDEAREGDGDEIVVRAGACLRAACRWLGVALAYVILLTASGMAAEPRTALVIGNASYLFAPLDNPTNDANDIAQALQRNGFEVILRTDADRSTMSEAIQAFGTVLKDKGGVGLLYYSGHGIQIDGENYMIPVGGSRFGEGDVKSTTVNAAIVLDLMAAARNELNIVILDACRDNPFGAKTRSTMRGLAKIESNAGLFVSYSTSPGAVALDGSGRNSPFTKHLVSAISTPDLSIEETFKRTLKGVYQETQGRQIPWISSSFFGNFVFRSTRQIVADTLAPPRTTTVATALPRQVQPQAPPGLAGLYRAVGTNPDGSRYAGMAALTPAREGYRFNWWIGRDVFTGSGRFAGRMLVVDWGQKHPVIYSFDKAKRLDGEWANNSATETLEHFAAAAEAPAPTLGGRYKVAGRNPNHTAYSGTVLIQAIPGGFEVRWRIGSTSYVGTGTVEGNILTVNWGQPTPVVYALANDGSLRGLWAGGKGEETLTPE
jgi:hypothetical protein